MAGPSAAPVPPNGAPLAAPPGATPNPLSAPVAPPMAAPLPMPPGTVNAPVPPTANGHPMPTHYQHQSQAMAPAPPVAGQPQQQLPPPAANGQPMQHPQLAQQQAVPQGQARGPQPLNGGWQSDKDVDERRKMIAKIVQLLRQRKPNAPQEWLNKLPQMAKRLEESLYRSAPSFEAYNDISTLKQRLQQLAMNIGMKTKRMQHQQAQSGEGAQPGQPVAQQPGQPQYQQRTQQPVQGGAPPMQPQPLQQPHLTTQQSQQPPPQQQQQMVQQSGAQISQANYATAPGAQPQQPPQPAAPATNAVAAAAPAAGAARQPSDRQQVLRHQQQRLLLLRHAAKCPHQDNQCPVTPHCAGMKRLWKHIAECKDQKCLVPHCVSSRYVLSHYHRCKDVRCPVCGPVREAIHRSHEKQKQMQALKQGHQAALKQQGQVPPGGAPPNKRQKTANGQYASQPGYPQQQFVQGQQYAQGGGFPQQQMVPANPNVKAGYVYSHPPPSAHPTGQSRSSGGMALSNGKVLGGVNSAPNQGPRPQEDHTLINCFTLEEIETHIKSLDTGLILPVQKLKPKFGEILKGLQSHSHGWVFNSPVDPVELGLADYFEVIDKPMDLGTVRKQLDNGVYKTVPEAQGDVNLTFENAMVYNPEGSVVWNMAKELKDKFTKDYDNLLKQCELEEEEKRKNGDACSLCGCEKLLFEPPIFYCNGMNCRAKRIRRNSYYFVGGNNQYHWCQPCYDDLKEKKPIELADITLRKSQLDKKKNNEIPEESWVQCDRCERWVHQICALFNTRQNTDQRSEFVCPSCTVVDRKKKESPGPTSSTPMAEDLPRTKLSEHLEKHVMSKLKAKMAEMAKEKADLENIPLEEATKVVHDGGGQIYVRQVASMSRTLDVRTRMKKRYSFKDYPSEFKYRCKCIVVFQNLDGVDVILFGLYVYEHDDTNAPPNQRTVYVSYLDSVHYMRPRRMRTFVYHELLISYLDYVRCKGYNTAHIWACPPLKGDDYILFAKPEDQKIPKDDRLRQWYQDMLKDSQRRGVVGNVTNAYDLYFASGKNDATILPYMEGDYFPAEMENIIKDMEEGKALSKAPIKASKKGKNDKKKAKAGARGGTRSSGIDKELLSASGIVPEGMDVKSLKEGGKDWVMKKLGETIHPMRESFLVAYLNWHGQSDENLVVPKDIQEYREKHGINAESLRLETIKEEEKMDVDGEEDKKPAAKEDSKGLDDKKVDPVTDGAKTDESKSADETKSADEAKSSDNADKDKPAEKDGAATEDSADQDKKDDSKEAEPSAEAGESDDKKPADKEDKNGEEEVKRDTDAMEVEDKKEEDKGKDGEEKKDDAMEEDGKKDEGKESTEVKVKKEEEEEKEGSSEKVEGSSDKVNIKEEPTDDEAGGYEKKDDNAAESDDKAKTDAAETGESDDKAKDIDASGESSAKPEEKEEGKADGDAAVAVAADPASVKVEDGKAEVISSDTATSPGGKNRSGKFAAMAKKHEAEETPSKDTKPNDAKSDGKKPDEQPSTSVTKDSKGRLVKVIDDDEEEMDCEFLNNRQLFLNLCQGNHYQFDSLRRAKHTSMMVLWHLHNRDAPKFVQQCAICAREILQGKRYHCPTCADFDQCIECLRNPAVPRHPHPLQAIPVGSQQSTLTPEQRKERQRSIALHMTLLLHASTCRSTKCNSANCAKMKGLLKHGAGCKVKANGGCNVCKRIWALLQIHARQCKTENCPVPNCMAIRERYRQLQLQQQAMDDRRREMMNQTYHQQSRG